MLIQLLKSLRAKQLYNCLPLHHVCFIYTYIHIYIYIYTHTHACSIYIVYLFFCFFVIWGGIGLFLTTFFRFWWTIGRGGITMFPFRGSMDENEQKKIYFFYFLFFLGCGKFRVKKLIITQKPHTLLSLFWFDSRIVGFSLSWSFPIWKREKRDHLSTLWQQILQREQLTHGPLSRHSPRLTHAPA